MTVHRKWISVACWILSLSSANAFAGGERLLLVGGGNSPVAARERLISWAGGTQAKLLFVTWATTYVDETYADLVRDFSPYHPASIQWAKSPPVSEAEKQQFLSQLSEASAVFFSGGDQNRILDVLQDTRIRNALWASYQSGIPFAGTSAGTAIMSPVAIAGGEPDVIDGSVVPTREGLGFLQGTIVDTHFIKRNRENRLFGVVLDHPEALGIGIDEGSSIAVENGRCAEVLGPTQVMLVDTLHAPGSLTVTLVQNGQYIDIAAHAKVAVCPVL
jgi:cyanophycinase